VIAAENTKVFIHILFYCFKGFLTVEGMVTDVVCALDAKFVLEDYFDSLNVEDIIIYNKYFLLLLLFVDGSYFNAALNEWKR